MEKQFSMDPGCEEISNSHLLCKETMNLLWIYIWINPFQLHDVIYRFFNSIRVNIYWCLQPLKWSFKHVSSYRSGKFDAESFFIKSQEDPTEHMYISFQVIQLYQLVSEHLPCRNSSPFTLGVSLLHFCGSCQWRWSKASVQIKKQLHTIHLITPEFPAFISHSFIQHVAVIQQNILSFLSRVISTYRNAPEGSVLKNQHAIWKLERLKFFMLCLKTAQLLNASF